MLVLAGLIVFWWRSLGDEKTKPCEPLGRVEPSVALRREEGGRGVRDPCIRVGVQLRALSGDARGILDRFEERVVPTQVIHNDLTFDNVLVDAEGHVSGIVDFGDMVRTALVFDVSSCLASVMQSRPDPLETSDAVLSG